MAYPSAADLIAGIRGEARDAIDALEAEQQEDLRLSAIVAVEGHCGQSFAGAVEEVRAIDGNGGSKLLLPSRLARLDTIAIYGTAIDAASVELSAAGDALTIIAPDRDSAYLRLMGSLDPDRDPSRRLFSWGRGTVTIDGAWGWLAVPDAVTVALRRDMASTALADANALSGTIRSFRALGLRDVRQGNLSATLTTVPSVGDDVAALLADYVWTEPGELA